MPTTDSRGPVYPQPVLAESVLRIVRAREEGAFPLVLDDLIVMVCPASDGRSIEVGSSTLLTPRQITVVQAVAKVPVTNLRMGLAADF